MNEANNTIQLSNHKQAQQLDDHTLSKVDDKIGMGIYHLKHLSQILLEVSDNMDQRDMLIGIIRDEAKSLDETYNAMFASGS